MLDAVAAPLLVRSHFGDMQFLHAMAPRDKQDAISVRENIIVWAEFTGEYLKVSFHYQHE